MHPDKIVNVLMFTIILGFIMMLAAVYIEKSRQTAEAEKCGSLGGAYVAEIETCFTSNIIIDVKE